jgi:hypothetical protein
MLSAMVACTAAAASGLPGFQPLLLLPLLLLLLYSYSMVRGRGKICSSVSIKATSGTVDGTAQLYMLQELYTGHALRVLLVLLLLVLVLLLLVQLLLVLLLLALLLWLLLLLALLPDRPCCTARWQLQQGAPLAMGRVALGGAAAAAVGTFFPSPSYQPEPIRRILHDLIGREAVFRCLLLSDAESD